MLLPTTSLLALSLVFLLGKLMVTVHTKSYSQDDGANPSGNNNNPMLDDDEQDRFWSDWMQEQQREAAASAMARAAPLRFAPAASLGIVASNRQNHWERPLSSPSRAGSFGNNGPNSFHDRSNGRGSGAAAPLGDVSWPDISWPGDIGAPALSSYGEHQRRSGDRRSGAAAPLGDISLPDFGVFDGSGPDTSWVPTWAEISSGIGDISPPDIGFPSLDIGTGAALESRETADGSGQTPYSGNLRRRSGAAPQTTLDWPEWSLPDISWSSSEAGNGAIADGSGRTPYSGNLRRRSGAAPQTTVDGLDIVWPTISYPGEGAIADGSGQTSYSGYRRKPQNPKSPSKWLAEAAPAHRGPDFDMD